MQSISVQRWRWFALLIVSGLLLTLAPPGRTAAQDTQYRRLPLETYRQKMRAGWIGQMVGVSFGAPTEFRYQSRIVPAADVPGLSPGLINQAFGQDDLYVEMTFLKTLETYGLEVSSAQAGIDFANSEYQLWHANKAGRENLRQGIAPPDSGHPRFNAYTDDIDYQIEADFAGLIAPGLPNEAIRLGETFGRIMNYGDGLYGGQFIACLYAEAFFEDDPRRLVEAGLSCIPAQSQYAEAIRDVLRWSQAYPDDWQQTWAQVQAKYHENPAYRRFASNAAAGTPPDFNIDAKLNGAYVVMGLLYGGRDPLQTMTIALRSGQDSDCNPASAGGILFTTLGADQLPALFSAGLDETKRFSYTDYDFPRLIAVSEQLARQSVLRAGGFIETEADGTEVLVIPVQPPQPGPLAQSWEPGPIAGSTFTDAEMAQIRFPLGGLAADVRRFAPGWTISGCLDSPHLGLKPQLQGRDGVLFTHPASRNTPCRLETTITLPASGDSSLRLEVGHFPDGDWVLIVKANGDELVNQVIGPQTADAGWLALDVDLSAYAGQEIHLEALNQANGRSWEGAYWHVLALITSE